jgi:glyoxylase-like metal-dependent hydrolase (beta-lactamase superfamily II)
VLRRIAPLALVALCWNLARAETPPASPETFRSVELADGVWLFRPPEGSTDLTNALVVERGDGLLVVNAQPSPAAAERFLADLARRSTLPVRYLVLTHPHAEAAGGASAFPGQTLVIATHGCLEALEDPSFDFAAEARLRPAQSGGWEDPPRRLPTLVLHARTRLDDEKTPVELLPIARAHTAGDMLVQLPGQNIIYGGALVFADRNPFARDGSIGGWLAALNNIAKTAPALVVPLSGPTLDARQLRQLRDCFAWLRGYVDLGFIEGLRSTELPNWVQQSDELGQRFDLQARPSFINSVIDQAVEEAVEQRRKRGLPY